MKKIQKGFTLIEILVVIGIIAILAAVVIVAINPGRQFAQARDSQRVSNIESILNAVGQRIADNKGSFAGTLNGVTCPTIPGSTTTIATSGGVDFSCLTPTYMQQLPFDPTSGSTGNTGYVVRQDTATGRIWIAATTTEPSIPRTTDLYIVR
jgi:prepilin-type N-terminal cleavage/methylation domain-containing protein